MKDYRQARQKMLLHVKRFVLCSELTQTHACLELFHNDLILFYCFWSLILAKVFGCSRSYGKRYFYLGFRRRKFKCWRCGQQSFPLGTPSHSNSHVLFLMSPDTRTMIEKQKLKVLCLYGYVSCKLYL